jgi:hypothetical protein
MWEVSMTPTLNDNEFTMNIPFDKWVTELIEKTVDHAVTKAVSNCPYSKDIKNFNNFIELWNKRWYLFAGGVIAFSALGGVGGAIIRSWIV